VIVRGAAMRDKPVVGVDVSKGGIVNL